MWPALAIAVILAIGIVVLHYRWRQRWTKAQSEIAELELLVQEKEEKRQRALAQARAQEEALFNSMAEGVLVLDAEGNIQLANRALQQLTGVGSHIQGKTIMEAFRLHELAHLVQQVSVQRHMRGMEFDWPGSVPKSIHVNAAAILDDDQRPHGFILVFHDLTRLKQLENTRQEFVANVSHELRTPLSLIKGYVETLIGGAKDDPKVTARFLQTILKHADRLTYLIEDLLTLSKLESGRAALNFQQVELHPLVARVLEDLASPAQAKTITLKNDLPLELAVRADADRIQQVLYNLVDNGIKYGRTGGVVEVSARPADDGENVEVTVKDNGPGIPLEAVDRVFERFYRVDRARSREQGGTGLGLSIVKHIVQSHGGRVWVKSDIGQGSAFAFTLAEQKDSMG